MSSTLGTTGTQKGWEFFLGPGALVTKVLTTLVTFPNHWKQKEKEIIQDPS